MTSSISIRVSDVSKRYRIGQSVPSLRSLFSLRGEGEQKETHHWAVRNANFTLKAGDSLGIIGPNGAGKTTILKLLSRVTYPTTGSIDVNGRLSALIELGAGFHPDLTGRENVYLNGTILGMRRAEIRDRFDQIVAFAGIGKYLDTPVKRYSSGMYARLGFAVAAHVDPELLLVDEVLAVGDMSFQKKCYDRMKQLVEQGTTMIFVSHNMRAIQEVCDRCLVMYRGRTAFDGPTPEATAEYSNIVREAAVEYSGEGVVEHGVAERVMTHAAVIEDVQIVRDDGQPGLTFDSGEHVSVRVQVDFNEQAESPVFACRFQHPNGQVIYDFTTEWANVPVPDFEAGTTAVIEFPLRMNLVAGTYQLGVNVAYNDLSRYYDRIDRALDFVITGGKGARGISNLEADFEIKDVREKRATGSSTNGNASNLMNLQSC